MKKPIQTILVCLLIAAAAQTAFSQQMPTKEQMRAMLPMLDARIKSNPADAGAIACRAYIYQQLGDRQKSLADWRALTTTTPGTHDEWITRSGAFIQLKDYPHALADTDAAIKLKGDDATDWCNRGSIHVFMNQINLAIQDYSKALQLDKKAPTAYGGLGEIAFKMHKYDQGVAYCNQALYLDRTQMDATYFRGKCYQALGKKSLADQDLHAAQVGGYVPGEPWIKFETRK